MVVTEEVVEDDDGSEDGEEDDDDEWEGEWERDTKRKQRAKRELLVPRSFGLMQEVFVPSLSSFFLLELRYPVTDPLKQTRPRGRR